MIFRTVRCSRVLILNSFFSEALFLFIKPCTINFIEIVKSHTAKVFLIHHKIHFHIDNFKYVSSIQEKIWLGNIKITQLLDYWLSSHLVVCKSRFGECFYPWIMLKQFFCYYFLTYGEGLQINKRKEKGSIPSHPFFIENRSFLYWNCPIKKYTCFKII